MYEKFYNLREKPFNLTSSSRFLYLGEAHKEALSLLRYGVLERKGFILLTGEVGTGKTTMIQAFLTTLEKATHCVYLSNPLLTPQDLYNYLAFSVFKKRVIYRSKAAFILDFEEFLKERLRRQEVFNLIIDEAQKLSFELLEEVRLLSNMETAEEKLINIFLVGQPELNRKLSEPVCRPLLQRISIRYHIRPLNLQETAEYLSTRLRAAGGRMEDIFPKSTSRAIYECSFGYPRIINILADNLLLFGYSRGKKEISADMVRECYEDMQIDSSVFEKRQDKGKETAGEKVVKLENRRVWRVALLLILLGLLVGFGMSDKGRSMTSPLFEMLAVNAPSWAVKVDKVNSEVSANEEIGRAGVVSPEAIGEENDRITAAKIEESPRVGEISAKREEEITAIPAMAKEKPLPEEIKKMESDRNAELWGSIKVKPGDTLISLAARQYGTADSGILNLIQENNPKITNIDLIEVGQTILFPPLPKREEEKAFTVHVASFKPFENAKHLFERFKREGYDAYMMPTLVPEKGRVYRITLGSFKSQAESDAYAQEILKQGIVEYAETVHREAKQSAR